MSTLEAKPLDEWDTYDFALLWNELARAPEMQPERPLPFCLVQGPLLRLEYRVWLGDFVDDRDPR